MLQANSLPAERNILENNVRNIGEIPTSAEFH